MDEFVVTLRDTGVDEGELTFTGAVRLLASLQLLAARAGRSLVGHEGPGRSPAAVERATELRLRPPRPGSTVLHVAVGEPGVLGDGLEHRTVDRLFALFACASTDAPPPDTSPTLGSAMVDVLDALADVSGRCELSSPSRRPVPLVPRKVSRSVWPTVQETGDVRSGVSVTGRLDRVDLRQARFRIRDAVGNDITLNQVDDVDEAGRLVGQTVTATGDATFSAAGRVVAITRARLDAVVLPRWTVAAVDFDQVTAPPGGGIPGVTAAEVDGFLASLRE